jgi:uncharacterized membrane protein YfcA
MPQKGTLPTMYNLSFMQWAAAIASALIFGLSKTALPGLGILAVPLMANVFPARISTGIVLPMLIFADAFAVIYYRRRAVWTHLISLIPWAAAGITCGYLIMSKIEDQQLKPIIGAITLIMLGINFWREKYSTQRDIPNGWSFACLMGLAAGITTMLANAAGPIMIIYLLAMRLPKMEFIGTGAWYFFLLNWFKVPFSLNLGLINSGSLSFNLLLFPVVAAGAVIGIVILKRIPEKRFIQAAQILALLAALNLMVK